MKAKLLFSDKYVYGDGAIREMLIWQLPRPDTERPHGLKYRLYYGFPAQYQVRYDNERGKGDHRHFRDEFGNGQEESYPWTSIQQLVADFQSEIRQLRGNQDD